MSPFSKSIFGVFIGTSIFNVYIKEHSCTCRAWEMSGIPCEHACAVIGFNGQNVVDFVDDQFKLSTQYLIYSGFFRGIKTYDMPKVDVDGVVRDVLGNEYFSLNPPCSKRPSGRPRKKCIQSQFQDKRTVYCSRCNMAGHNRKKLEYIKYWVGRQLLN